MTIVPGDFALTLRQVRAVTAFATSNAETVLAVFTAARPDDRRPAEALAAAHAFIDGGRRTLSLRTTATRAHRAAAEADGEPARLAARAAGDAAGSAYLHPIAKATQVGHILRSAACVVRIAELGAGGDPDAGAAAVRTALSDVARRADPAVVEVLRLYPPVPPGRSRLDGLLADVDVLLRTGP